MAEPILDPEYWRTRLQTAPPSQIHTAIFRCPYERWVAIENKHREILAASIHDTESVLDVGCAWGRLLSLMPRSWNGEYLGVDLSPDFINLARLQYGTRRFEVLDISTLEAAPIEPRYNWAIMISIRPMIVRNLGIEYWTGVERGIRRSAEKLLYLEYDPDDHGRIE